MLDDLARVSDAAEFQTALKTMAAGKSRGPSMTWFLSFIQHSGSHRSEFHELNPPGHSCRPVAIKHKHWIDLPSSERSRPGIYWTLTLYHTLEPIVHAFCESATVAAPKTLAWSNQRRSSSVPFGSLYTRRSPCTARNYCMGSSIRATANYAKVGLQYNLVMTRLVGFSFFRPCPVWDFHMHLFQWWRCFLLMMLQPFP